MTDPASDNAYILTWDRGRICVTIPLDSRINLPILYGQATYKHFSSFANGFSSFPAIIEDDDDESTTETMRIDGSPPYAAGRSPPTTPQMVSFSDEQISNNPKEPSITIDDPVTHRDKDLFLSWHVKMGHAPFNVIRWAARQGIIPKKLGECENAVCPACMYGKQKRRPWRHKGESNSRSIKNAARPGEFVSCDQLISGTPGLIAQTTGKLTTSRYWVATVFVDQFSGLDYVHLQESKSANETIEAKRSVRLEG